MSRAFDLIGLLFAPALEKLQHFQGLLGKRTFLEVLKLAHQVILDGELLEVLNENRDEKVEKDQLAQDQQGNEEACSEVGVGCSVVVKVERHPAIVG